MAGLQSYLTIRWLGWGLAPKRLSHLFWLMAVMSLSLVSLNAHSDTYPPTRQYMIAYDKTLTIYPTFEAAAQVAWNNYKVPFFWPSTVKLDWFTSSFIGNGCQSKAEPVLDSHYQGMWVDINTSDMSYADDNGNPYNPPLPGCISISTPVSIQKVCLSGGDLADTGNGMQCINAPPCTPPATRDPVSGACVAPADHCLVKPIPALPEPKDDKDYACTQSLDKGKGNDVDGACPPLNAKLTAWNGEMQCFANKLAALHPPIPYDGPSSTIRTEAYQNHLLSVWNKSKEIADLSDAEKLVCAARIADVNAQMAYHHIKHQPSNKGGDAEHVLGNAFDIPESVANALIERVTMTKVKASIAVYHPGCISCMHIPMVTGNVQDYISSSAANPPACNLDWGGRFNDLIHFQLLHP